MPFNAKLTGLKAEVERLVGEDSQQPTPRKHVMTILAKYYIEHFFPKGYTPTEEPYRTIIENFKGFQVLPEPKSSHNSLIFSEFWYRTIEEAVQKAVVHLEGRLPSNEEIARYGHHAIFPDGKQQWKWRDILILELTLGKDSLNFTLKTIPYS